MSDTSQYESRKGRLTCKPREAFDFVTDIRNFRRFVPEGSISDLHIERDSCSFKVTSLGNIKLQLTEKEPHNKVVYNGTVFGSNEFYMIINITGSTSGNAEVVLKLTAQLNPLLKMMAAQYISRFLDSLIDEMEKFRDWKDTMG